MHTNILFLQPAPQKQLLGSRRKIVKLCRRDVFAQPEPDDQLLIAARAAKIGCSYASTKLLIGNYRTLMSLEGRIVGVDSSKLDRFLTGLQNLQRDPYCEVQKRRRLPVSLSLLICIKEVLGGLPWSSFAKKSRSFAEGSGCLNSWFHEEDGVG